MKVLRRDLTRIKIKLQTSDYPNTWSGFFFGIPTKEMLLSTLQQELKRSVEEPDPEANFFRNLIEAINLWHGSSGNIYCAGLSIAAVTCVVTDHLYEGEKK